MRKDIGDLKKHSNNKLQRVVRKWSLTLISSQRALILFCLFFFHYRVQGRRFLFKIHNFAALFLVKLFQNSLVCLFLLELFLYLSEESLNLLHRIDVGVLLVKQQNLPENRLFLLWTGYFKVCLRQLPEVGPLYQLNRRLLALWLHKLSVSFLTDYSFRVVHCQTKPVFIENWSKHFVESLAIFRSHKGSHLLAFAIILLLLLLLFGLLLSRLLVRNTEVLHHDHQFMEHDLVLYFWLAEHFEQASNF